MGRRAILIAAFALLASGCAKDQAQQAVSSPVTLTGTVNIHESKDLTASGGTIRFAVEIDDYYFNPTFVKAAPGAQATVLLDNEGKQRHTFTIESLDVDQELQPGTKADLTFTLPQSGVVNLFCRFHRDRGMQGAFYFTAGETVGTPSAPSTGGGYPRGY